MPKLPDALQGLPLDHVGIATADLEAASAAYEHLGLPRDGEDEHMEAQGVRVRAYRSGGSLLELLEPTRPDSPVATFLAKKGPGLHHIAFRVAEIDAALTHLRLEGAPFLSDAPQPGRHHTQVMFIHPRWASGVLIELVAYPNAAKAKSH